MVLYACADDVAVADVALVVVEMPAGLRNELWASCAHTHTRNHSTSVHPTDLTQQTTIIFSCFILFFGQVGRIYNDDGTKWLTVLAGSTMCYNTRGGGHVR